MITANDAGTRARWAVAWSSKGRIVRKNFGTDYSEAMKLYAKAVIAEKKATTLICTNMSFAPPEELQPRLVRGYRRVGRRKEWVEGWLDPMKKRNARGVWWCPYCAKLREFILRKGFKVNGVYVPEPGYHCPMCNISHRDGAVRKWNPAARKMYSAPPWQRTRRKRK